MSDVKCQILNFYSDYKTHYTFDPNTVILPYGVYLD